MVGVEEREDGRTQVRLEISKCILKFSISLEENERALLVLL